MVDSFEQDLHLPRGVQDVDALGVWVVAHAEVPRDGVGELYHLVLSIFKRVGHEVHGLVLSDRVLLDPGLLRLEVPKLWFVGQTVLKLPEGRQETSPESLQLSVLPAQTKLDGEPEALEEINIKCVC